MLSSFLENSWNSLVIVKRSYALGKGLRMLIVCFSKDSEESSIVDGIYFPCFFLKSRVCASQTRVCYELLDWITWLLGEENVYIKIPFLHETSYFLLLGTSWNFRKVFAPGLATSRAIERVGRLFSISGKGKPAGSVGAFSIVCKWDIISTVWPSKIIWIG